MKIIFLINSAFPYYAGGIETWTYNISKALCNEHEIIIISEDYKPYPLMFNGIPSKVKLCKYKTMLSYTFLRPFVRSYVKLINLFIGAYSKGKVLNNIINNDDKFYIIALDTMFNIKSGIWGMRKNSNVKLIASSRGPHAEIYSKSFPLCKKLLFQFERKMLMTVDAIWANGYDTIELLEKKGFNAKLMRNGVNFEEIENESNNYDFEIEWNTKNIKIVSVGTLLPIKGIYELIDAVSIINKRNIYNIEVFFIGKGNQTKYIDYAKSLNISDSIHFFGHKYNAFLYMKNCDIIACLSGGSGMSMAAIEAMASKTPIIAWNNEVYKQFNTNSKTMYLVEEHNVKDLADGIVNMIENYDRCKEMAENAKIEAKSYDWNTIAKELVENLRRVN